jgi:ribosome-binding protein aMBF1 (putative translation factor)
VQGNNGHAGTGINPEVEESGEAHLRGMLRTDGEFRRAWEVNRNRRELGMFILEKRMELGLSQRELAERIGTSQNRIYLLENGEANPTLDTLQRLADVLHFPLIIQPREELVAGAQAR